LLELELFQQKLNQLTLLLKKLLNEIDYINLKINFYAKDYIKKLDQNLLFY